MPRSLATFELATLAFVEIDESPVRSFVRGAWLASEAADPALRAWHAVVRRELKP